MATLEKIFVQNFRNITSAQLRFCPGVNCICGDNGQGKTNLLDAIHYLSMTKSAFGYSDANCIRYGCGSFAISGTFRMQDGLQSTFSIDADGLSKTVRRDGKSYPRLGAHIGVLPVVVVSPQDGALVSESGEGRRRFINAVLSQMDPLYLQSLQRYNRLLAQRNRCLKEAVVDDGLLDVVDCQMSECADSICARRAEFVCLLEGIVSPYYDRLSGSKETVGISYRSDLVRGGQVCCGSLKDILAGNLARDKFLKYTTSGIQRDDFIFTMGSHPIRSCGSQGQQKSFLVALKLSQYDIMRSSYGYPPIMLLDDVFDKLDTGRILNLLEVVSGNDCGQIFVTDTNRQRMESIVEGIAGDALYFNAENGEF